LPPRRSLLRRRRRGCQRRARGRFHAARASVGAGELTCMSWSRLGGSAGVYSGRCLPRDLAAPRQSHGRRRHMIGPPHRAAFRPTHQRRLIHKSPTDPPRPQPPHRAAPTRAAHSPKHKAARSRPTRTRQPRPRAPQSARFAAESSREVVGPTGRPPPSVAAPLRRAPEQRHIQRRALASRSPRGRRDSDRSIAAKTRPSRQTPSLRRRCLRTRAYGCKTRPRSINSIARNQSRPACTSSSPSKCSEQVSATGSLQGETSACGCESRYCPPWH